jgi:gamma-glutamyl-gamma-aminobutyrate hydrolase PuuD
MNKKIYVVGGAQHYANWTGLTLTSNFKNADLIMFTGGEDVDPALYGESVGYRTYINPVRDAYEIEMFQEALRLKKKMIGICRGSQFLTVMAGGKLVQDVNNHGIAGTHEIYLPFEDDDISITSTHHQMLYPFDIDKKDYLILGYTKNPLSTSYLNGNNEEIKLPKDFVEPEIVLYKNINALAIQGHPEMMNQYSPSIKELKKMLINFMNIKFKNVYEKSK